VHANDAKQLQSLIDSGASATTDDDGSTLLHIACTYDTAAECVQVLLASGADIEAPDKYGSTALHFAVSSDAEAVVRILLTKGASIHATDRYKRTPLFYSSNSEVVTLLLDNGADIEARDSDGKTPLYYACRLNNVTAFNALIKAGAKVDTINNKGDTLLHVAVSYNAGTEVSEALVAAGVRVDIRNKAGDTAYDIACASKLDDKVLNLLRPVAAASSSIVHVGIASNRGSEAVATNNAVKLDSTAPVPVVVMSSSVVDAVNQLNTTQPSHSVRTTPMLSDSEASVLDTWLCKWLIDIGFDETEACKYTAAMTALKCYKAVALAALTEVKATKLVTAAGVSEFEIDMFIAGWQQLKVTYQLTVNTATSQSVTPVTSKPASPVAVQVTSVNSRPQSPISLVSDPTLRYTDRHIMVGTVSSSVLTTIYQAVDHNTKRAVVLKRSPLSMTIAAQVSCVSLHIYC
jgi:hypothetical protein